ncbi:hypothetical protein F4781DRAFT_404246 [Annulohypoxylon bovei var. microspora]|nr:hypothetical protein F4781DRAFT_404246 [Annulohypoxylon bovei var. microspora]
MSNTPTPPNGMSGINLDLLCFAFQPRDGTTHVRVLNSFLRDDRLPNARRVSSDFDYEAFRTYLLENFGIPWNQAINIRLELVSQGSPAASSIPRSFTITDEDNFWLFLLYVQTGNHVISRDIVPGGWAIPVPIGDGLSPKGKKETTKPKERNKVPDPKGKKKVPPPKKPLYDLVSDESGEEDPGEEDPGEENPGRKSPDRISSDGNISDGEDPDIKTPPRNPRILDILKTGIGSPGTPSPPPKQPRIDPKTKAKAKGGRWNDDDEEVEDPRREKRNEPDNNPTGDYLDEVEEGAVDVDDEPGDSETAKGMTDRMRIGLDEHTDPSWESVARFYAIPETAHEARIPGLNMTPRDDQLYAAYFILTRPLDNINIGLIGDDVGLGKTGVVLLTAYLHHRIQCAMQEVQEEWNKKDTILRLQHLPWSKEKKPVDARCPSQYHMVSRYGFQCPCVQQVVYSVGRKLQPNPSIIICPATLVPAWIDEAEKWIDFSWNSPANDISLTAFHGHFKRGHWFHGNDAMEDSRALPIYDPTHKGRRYRNTSENQLPLRSRFLIIVPNLQAMTLVGNYTDARRTLIDASGISRKVSNVCTLSATFVFMDEAHKYTNSNTGPLQLISRISEDCTEGPTVAVALSASLLSGGPSLWGGMIGHMFREPTVGIEGLRDRDGLNKYRADFDYLVKNLAILDSQVDNSAKRNAQRRFQELQEFLKSFLPRVMLNRTSRTVFHGRMVTRQSRDALIQNTDMPDGPARDAHRALASSVNTWVTESYQEQMREWQDGGEEGDMPRRESVQSRLLNSLVVKGVKVHRSYEIIIRSSCFPAVAQLIQHNAVEYESLLSNSVVEIAQKITKVLAGQTAFISSRPSNTYSINNAVTEILKESPFYPYADLLTDQSPKFALICRCLGHLKALRTRPYELNPEFPNPGIEPSDGSRVRHCLIFSETQLSAFLTFMFLYIEYRNTYDFLYMHAGLSAAERYEMVKAIQKPCAPTDRNKILISTFNIAGVGFNIQRANYCLITEMPRSRDIQNQAKGRIDRTGQEMEPISIQMHDRNNLAEAVRFRRSINRAILSDPGELNLTSFE